MLRQKDSEIIRGHDLSHNSNHLEAAVKDADTQIDMLKRDLEGVRYGNDALLDRNHELKEEIDSLTQHSELLTCQNRELQRELDSFVETDDIVRRNLDRKDKVHMIRSKVDEVIKKSMGDLVSKSPSRARSPMDHSQY
jgi:FtsZ-binding cell division protein ZapB